MYLYRDRNTFMCVKMISTYGVYLVASYKLNNSMQCEFFLSMLCCHLVFTNRKANSFQLGKHFSVYTFKKFLFKILNTCVHLIRG